MSRNYCTGLRDVDPETNTCCHQHDRDYGVKGTVTRAQADKRLRECLIKNGKPIRGWLFWIACRLGGWVFWKDKIKQ
ncbi:hypothetical protein [Aeromonas veronii]|uniref:hypothetical protein n=1 Tax=Aeromonas veronii TaxID=654 RepID=UPI0024864A9F|nr:hypothetical protein [Aeromonas veronii]